MCSSQLSNSGSDVLFPHLLIFYFYFYVLPEAVHGILIYIRFCNLAREVTGLSFIGSVPQRVRAANLLACETYKAEPL